jgi:hypothetical protein
VIYYIVVVVMIRTRLATAFAIGYLLVPTAAIPALAFGARSRVSAWLVPLDDTAIVGTLAAFTIYRRNPS